MKNGTLAWLAAALVLSGCSATPSPGDPCTRASDCRAPLTCQLGRCRASCRSAGDCAAGARCLAGSIGGVCSLGDESSCASTSCTAPLRCGQSQCRTQCIADSDCLAGTCVSATCAEPISGRDAGIVPRDAGSDAGSDAGPLPMDAGPDTLAIDVGLDAGPVDDTGADLADADAAP